MKQGDSARQRDWEVASGVKAAMVRRWVDMSKVDLFVMKGKVEVKGSLQFSNVTIKSAAEGNILLRGLDVAVRSVHGVQSVRWELKDWEKNGDKWIRKGPKAAK